MRLPKGEPAQQTDDAVSLKIDRGSLHTASSTKGKFGRSNKICYLHSMPIFELACTSDYDSNLICDLVSINHFFFGLRHSTHINSASLYDVYCLGIQDRPRGIEVFNSIATCISLIDFVVHITSW